MVSIVSNQWIPYECRALGHIEGHFRDLFFVQFSRRTLRKMGTMCPSALSKCPEQFALLPMQNRVRLVPAFWGSEKFTYRTFWENERYRKMAQLRLLPKIAPLYRRRKTLTETLSSTPQSGHDKAPVRPSWGSFLQTTCQKHCILAQIFIISVFRTIYAKRSVFHRAMKR